MKKQDNNLKYYLVLIDTQWNVNTYGSEYAAGADLVLIDTQWNVNLFKCWSAQLYRPVLIDTQWNVNNSDDYISYNSDRF